MQSISYDLRDRKTKIAPGSSLRQIDRTLDCLGNNLMGMLWMMQLSLAALQETPDLEQAKKNLQDALRAGNRAKDLMRVVLNSWKPKPVGKTIFRSQSLPRIKRFNIYYSSRKNGEYLRQLIDASGMGLVAETGNLKHLPAPGVRGADVVLLEYHEDNAKLDRWIQESAANPQGPAIYLYLREFSLLKLWKAIQLGAKECLILPVTEEQLQAAVNRLDDRDGSPGAPGDSGVKNRPPAHIASARFKGIGV